MIHGREGRSIPIMSNAPGKPGPVPISPLCFLLLSQKSTYDMHHFVGLPFFPSILRWSLTSPVPPSLPVHKLVASFHFLLDPLFVFSFSGGYY
jgi:hypothetical protein